jgi:hypothetical protein
MHKLILIVTLAFSLGSGPALADITRHCKARWEVRSPSGASRFFGDFDSHGQCPGKAWANDCRRKARAFAQTCFWDAWANRNSTAIKSGAQKPPHCVGRASFGVRNYSVRDVKRDVEREACKWALREEDGDVKPFKSFEVLILGRTSGDKRCGGEVLLTATYEIRTAMCA